MNCRLNLENFQLALCHQPCKLMIVLLNSPKTRLTCSLQLSNDLATADTWSLWNESRKIDKLSAGGEIFHGLKCFLLVFQANTEADRLQWVYTLGLAAQVIAKVNIKSFKFSINCLQFSAINWVLQNQTIHWTNRSSKQISRGTCSWHKA